MEMIKCPACAANNSAKRQICHMCGQLLSAPQETETEKDSLHLVSEELKAAAEAAMKEAGRTAGPAVAEPESTLVTPTTREDKTLHDRQGRERVTIIVAAIVTLIAIGYLLYWFLPKRSASEAPTVVTRRTESSPALPERTLEPQFPAVSPTPQTPPVLSEISEEEPLPEEEPAEEEVMAEAAIAAVEETAVGAVSPYVPPLLSLLEADLEVNLSGGLGSYQGVVTQQGDNTSIATVSFQGNTLYGSVSVLMRRYDQGWQAGWQATHYKDLLLTFTPPVTVITGEEEIEETIVGARIGTGGFEPLEDLADPDPPLEYIYSY